MYSFPSLPFLLHSPHYCLTDGSHACGGAGQPGTGVPIRGWVQRCTSDLAGGAWPGAALADHVDTGFTDAPSRDTAREEEPGSVPLPAGHSGMSLQTGCCPAVPAPASQRAILDLLGRAARQQNSPVSEEGLMCSGPL